MASFFLMLLLLAVFRLDFCNHLLELFQVKFVTFNLISISLKTTYWSHEMPAFKKNDRVEFTYEGELIYGVVTKGGSKVKLTADGQKYSYTVGEASLRHSTKPMPSDAPHLMDVYSLKKYAEHSAMSAETVAFSSEIQKNGVSIIAAKNNGCGGCNAYYPLSGGYETVNKFEEDAKQWLIDHGMPKEDVSEASNLWIIWKSSSAPFGVTATQYVADWQESMAAVLGSHEDLESPAPRM